MKNSTDWDKIKLFYYVAKHGSFTAAAEILNTSQSSLSRSIQSLEYHLRVTLFQRLSRGLILSKQGEVLFQATEKVFSALSRAEMLMFEEGDDIEGSLKIAMTMSLAMGWVPPHISNFIHLYPKLNVTIIDNNGQLDFKARDVDVFIGPFIDHAPDLIQEPLVSFHMKLYASQEYLDQYGTPAKPEDLDQHQLIVFGYDAANPYADVNWPLRMGMPKGALREPYLCINTSSAMQKAAELHHGIVSLSAEHHRMNKSTLVEILPTVAKPVVPIYYTYAEQLQYSRRVQTLGAYLKKQLVL